MLTQEAIFIATIKGTSLVIKTRPFTHVHIEYGCVHRPAGPDHGPDTPASWVILFKKLS